MKKAQKAETPVQVLLSGLDSLDLSTRYMLCRPILEKCLKARASAQAQHKAEPVELAGEVFMVQPHGKQGFPLIIENRSLTIVARTSPAAIPEMPNTLISFASVYLHSRDWTQAYADVVAFLAKVMAAPPGEADETRTEHDEQGRVVTRRDGSAYAIEIPVSEVGFEAGAFTVSRADLCLDFQGWQPGLDDVLCFCVPPNLKQAWYWQGRSFTGARFGEGNIVLRAYEKSREIRANSKGWFKDLWRETGKYDEDRPVWRVEFQLRREALKSFRDIEPARALAVEGKFQRGIATVEQLAAGYSRLWSYLTTRWVTLRVPPYAMTSEQIEAARRDRWAIHPAWQVVSRHCVEAEPLHRIETSRGRDAEGLAPGFAGYGASIAALLGLAPEDGSLVEIENAVGTFGVIRDELGSKAAKILKRACENAGMPLEEFKPLEIAELMATLLLNGRMPEADHVETELQGLLEAWRVRSRTERKAAVFAEIEASGELLKLPVAYGADREGGPHGA